MLKVELIGYLGADAEVKSINGVEFVAMRVADSSTWTDREGVRHEQTDWVDVTLSKVTKVLDFLKKGTLVYVRGDMSKRIYSSEKDKCEKVGITIHAKEIQLLSGSKRDVDSGNSNSEVKYDGF